MTTAAEAQYYRDVNRIAKSLEIIANVLSDMKEEMPDNIRLIENAIRWRPR